MDLTTINLILNAVMILIGGDGIHWTDTGAAGVNGHLTVKNLITAYAAAQSL
jgi:hypothetical protein